MLTEIVKNCVNNYLKTTKEIDRDTANGFITRTLQYHYEKNYFSILPNNVKTRLSEEDLKRKL